MKIKKKVKIYGTQFHKNTTSFITQIDGNIRDELLKILKGDDIEMTLELKEPILDEKEKEYLSAVIRPFRNKVKYIKKDITLIGETVKYIAICVHSEYLSPHNEYINLPCFEQNTMYKGMESEKEYTLKELGL